MGRMPHLVSHRYNPQVGACPNLCGLPDSAALAILDRLRRESRPTLKPNYLHRRRITERWLCQAASEALVERPAYFFLGDFSHGEDVSRPATLLLPISVFPSDAITFTLGDSMNVVEQSDREIYTVQQLTEMFAANALGDFAVSDRDGFQARFIELQLWDRARVAVAQRDCSVQCIQSPAMSCDVDHVP